MPRYIAIIELLIEAEDESSAADSVGEMLRPMMKPYADSPENTCLVDWQYTGNSGETLREAEGIDLECFEYGNWSKG